MAHTPGPWIVEPDLSEIGKGGVKMSTGNAVGTADDYEWGYLQIEDARLIAAAPELLAALKLYVDHFGDPLKVAVAAIAKAEGR